MKRSRPAPILGTTAAVLAALVLAASLAAGWSEEGVRIVVRWTAKLAVVLFAAAFSAGALRALWPHPATRALVRNRRWVGLSFALAHTFHLAALVALGVAFPTPFLDELQSTTLVGGGLAYAFLFAMAATSSDAAVRRLGGRRWRLLHTVGGWYLWLIFAQSYLPRAVADPAYLPFGAVVLAVPALRGARALRRRSAGGVGGEPASA